MFSFLYRLLTDLGAPFIQFYLKRRLARGREDPARFNERLGIASLIRPDGILIWCHAASVGEAASLLALIDKIHELNPELTLLITTGTVTSARMLTGKLPIWAMHQYVPVDRLPYVKRFLDHWRPDMALWIESELWPNMLKELRNRLITAMLVNARMSDKSFVNWYRVKGWAQELLGSFSLILTQSDDERSRFVALGGRPVAYVGNLKYAAKPLNADVSSLQELQQSTAGRALWLMASTHRGEEAMAIAAHKTLKAKWPHLLTIIVPRHAIRGTEIAMLAERAELTIARRSRAQKILPQTDIYLADTMGELGLLYRLSQLCVVGGSFVPVGGHNPIEPAQLDCAVIFGPHMHNFSEIAREFVVQHAGVALKHDNELAFTLDRLLGDAKERAHYTMAAKMLADHKQNVLQHILDRLRPLLKTIGVSVA